MGATPLRMLVLGENAHASEIREDDKRSFIVHRKITDLIFLLFNTTAAIVDGSFQLEDAEVRVRDSNESSDNSKMFVRQKLLEALSKVSNEGRTLAILCCFSIE